MEGVSTALFVLPILAALFFGSAVARADGSESLAVLPEVQRFTGDLIALHNGANFLDLDGDGVNDVIFKSWSDNGNAHGFNVYLVSRHASESIEGVDQWQTVRIDNVGSRSGVAAGGSVLTDEPHTGEDMIREVVFTRERSASGTAVVALYVADRGATIKKSLGELTAVDIVRYELNQNTDGLPGWSPWYFRPTGYRHTRALYCHAGLALTKELGFPPSDETLAADTSDCVRPASE